MSQPKVTHLKQPRVVYVDIFETMYFGAGGKVGFTLEDSEGILPVEIYDEWANAKAFLKAFPDEATLREFIRNETSYRILIRDGKATLTIRGEAIWRVCRLRESFKQHNLEDAPLDDMVHELKSQEASDINNLGLSEQIKFLADNGFEVVEDVEL